MTGRGQGAFEYLLILGGVVLAAAVTIIIVQGSAGEVNNTLSVASNDYLSALANQQQNIEKNFSEKYATPAGCSYSNPPCRVSQDCNSSNNSCYAYLNTTRNGCDYNNPGCPFGYSCRYNYCQPDKSAAAASLVNGACGSSSGAVFTSVPSANLCSAGTASAVSGSGPWAWTCIGSYGGTTVGCSTIVVVGGACGSSNGASFPSIPSTNLCSAGTASAVSGSGPWAWFCNGSFGGANASCLANRVTSGVCGSSNGASFYSIPTTNLCSAGTASTVSGSGPWAWTCAGLYGGTPASCSANKKVNGSCGSANGHVRTAIPAGSDLCSAGTASAVSGSGPWSWTCAGLYGGSNASCATLAPTYAVVQFTANATWTVPAGITAVDVYVLGGGGGGSSVGGNGGGRGGGGGYSRNTFNYAVTPSATVAVVVGAGGGVTGAYGFTGVNGSASSFGSIVANGGAGALSGGSGGNGGSGGGGACSSCSANGGTNGSNGVGSSAGTGQGTSTVPFLDSVNYKPLGGGGGGDSYRDGVPSHVTGGYYGGGVGCASDYCTGGNGVANTGGGGGGGDGGSRPGGSGGSGIVIVRYVNNSG